MTLSVAVERALAACAAVLKALSIANDGAANEILARLSMQQSASARECERKGSIRDLVESI